MASKQQLIKEVAQEKGWSQEDVKRAIKECGKDATTKEEIFVCLDIYAGPALKKLNYQNGAQKRVIKQLKQAIQQLGEQLVSVQKFYANQMVPTLKATIAEQASHIKEFLKRRRDGNE